MAINSTYIDQLGNLTIFEDTDILIVQKTAGGETKITTLADFKNHIFNTLLSGKYHTKEELDVILSDLQLKVSNNETNIISLSDTVTSLSNSINSLDTRVYNNETNIITLQSDLQNAVVRVGDVEFRCDQLQLSIDDINSRIYTFATSAEAIAGTETLKYISPATLQSTLVSETEKQPFTTGDVDPTGFWGNTSLSIKNAFIHLKTKLSEYYTKLEIDSLFTSYYTKTETDTKLSGKSDNGHGHTIADVTNLQTSLDGKEPVIVKNSAFNKSFGSLSGDVAEGDKVLFKTGSNGETYQLPAKPLGTYTLSTTEDVPDVSAQIKVEAESADFNTGDVDTTGFWGATLLTINQGLQKIKTKFTEYYTKLEVDNLFTSYYTKTQVDTSLSGKSDNGHGHTVATTTADGFFAATDKTKLDGVAANANNYVHPSGDGNLHIPATSTTNNLKVLKAGTTAGSIAWSNVDWTEITNVPATFTPSPHDHTISDVINLQTTLDGKEPVIVKNTAFNKNFGTLGGEIPEADKVVFKTDIAYTYSPDIDLIDDDANSSTPHLKTINLNYDFISVYAQTNSELTLSGGETGKIYTVGILQEKGGMHNIEITNLKNSSNVFNLEDGVVEYLIIRCYTGSYFLDNTYTEYIGNVRNV